MSLCCGNLPPTCVVYSSEKVLPALQIWTVTMLLLHQRRSCHVGASLGQPTNADVSIYWLRRLLTDMSPPRLRPIFGLGTCDTLEGRWGRRRGGRNHRNPLTVPPHRQARRRLVTFDGSLEPTHIGGDGFTQLPAIGGQAHEGTRERGERACITRER